MNKADLLFAEGRLAEASDAYEAVLAEAPGMVAAILGAGICARHMGKLDAALGYFKAAIEAAPTLAGPKLEAATELRELGRLDEAEAMAHEALAVAPDNVHAYINLAYCARKRGQQDNALNYFRSAVEVAPTLPGPKLEVATELRELGRLDEAEAMAHEALAVAPGNVHAYINMAYCARQRGQRDKALDYFRSAIEAAPTLPGPKLEAATELSELGRLDEAEAMAHEALAVAPGNVHAYINLAYCARKRGQQDKALNYFRSAVEVAPTLPGPKLEVATELRELGRLDEAEAMAHEALVAAPGNVHAYINLAYSARKRGQRGKALDYFRSAIEAAPTLPGPKLEAAAELRELDDFDAAREMVGRVLTAGGNTPYVLIMLGQIERAAGCTVAALAAFSAAHAADRHSAAALVEMAVEYRQLGLQAECDRHLALAIECDPRNAQALSRRAEQALMANSTELALELYSEAAADLPGHAEFRFGQVSALARLGRIRDALNVLHGIEEGWGASAFLYIRQISLLCQLGDYYGALNLARQATDRDPFSFWLWAERVRAEMFVGEDADVEACLAAMLPSTPREQAHLEQLKGMWAESRWQLREAIAHYEQAASVLTQDPMIQNLLVRSKIMAMDLEGARQNLRRARNLEAPGLKLRGESPNTSQTEFGQLLNEFTVDYAVCAKLTELAGFPAENRLAELPALIRANPDNTAPAVNLFLTLRESGALAVSHQGEDRSIPRIIMQFWDEAVIPEDIGELMNSWRMTNLDHDHKVFDDTCAQMWLQEHYPPQVLLAYRRSREAAQKSDILRLAWLARHGGVYADADDRCLRPLSTILPAGARLVLSQEVLGTVGNNFIAVTPGHPAIEMALRLAVDAVNRGDNDGVWYSTGPALLTRALSCVLTVSGNVQMDGTVILTLRELFQAVAIGCAAAYKATGRHWSQTALARSKSRP